MSKMLTEIVVEYVWIGNYSQTLGPFLCNDSRKRRSKRIHEAILISWIRCIRGKILGFQITASSRKYMAIDQKIN